MMMMPYFGVRIVCRLKAQIVDSHFLEESLHEPWRGWYDRKLDQSSQGWQIAPTD